MQQKTLENKIVLKSNFKKEIAAKIFESVFEEIKNALLKKENIYIDELGSFSVEHRESKIVTDIEKKGTVLLPPKDKIVFKSSDSLIKFLKD